jgi:hypothetical protein
MESPTSGRQLADYDYDDLENREVIRLIKAEPSQLEESLVSKPYRMATFKIDDCPEYHALSYCWGPHGRSEPIVCNGQTLKVTTPLKGCLAELRTIPELDTWFWIDQVCIDQDNLYEKSRQVRLMPRKYQRAIRTVVWVAPVGHVTHTPSPSGAGPRFNDEDEIFFAFAKLVFITCEMKEDLSYCPVGRAQLSVDWYSDPDCAHWTGRLPRSRSIEMPDDLLLWGIGSIADHFWDQLVSFFDAPWFHRIWVIQEVFHSQRVPYLLYNGCRRNFLHVLSAGAFVSQNIAVFARSGRPGLSLSRLRATRHARLLLQLAVAKSDWALESLVWRTARYKASDSRDRIYTLLSLAGDFSRGNPPPRELAPDYTRPPGQVARDATRYIIETSKNLLVLSLINREYGELQLYPRADAAPSWTYVPSDDVCDLQFGEEQYVLKGSPYTIERKGYKAASHRATRTYFRGDMDVLTLYGRRFHEIVDTGHYDDDDNGNGTSAPRLLRWCRQGYDSVRAVWQPRADQFLVLFLATLAARHDVLTSEARPSVADMVAWWAAHGGAPDWAAAAGPAAGVISAAAASEAGNPAIVDRWAAMYDTGGVFQHRQFGTTSGGDMLVGPRAMRRGDVVCLLDGGQLPFVLRPLPCPRSLVGEEGTTTPTGDRGASRWLFVGECYVNRFNQDVRSHILSGSLLGEWFDLV